MFLSIFNALFPVAFVIFLGWLAGYKKIVDKAHNQSFAAYVMDFSFPALLFSITSTTNPRHFESIEPIVLFLLALMGMYCIGLLIYKYCMRRSLAECGQGAFVCAFPDMAFMGIPIFSTLFGPDSLIFIAIGNIISSLLMIPITISLLETKDYKEKRRFHIKNLVFSFFKKPLVFAPVLGILFSLLKIHLPSQLQDALLLIGKTTSGVSLFTLGLIMSSYAIKLSKIVSLNIILKNLVQPSIMLILVLLLNLKGLIAKEGILLCAMPTASMAAMFALKYNVNIEESSSSIILGTLLSFITLFLFMIIVNVVF
jgi:hypothetical protein